MKHTFLFESNLNNLFLSDDVKTSEKQCDYCAKRKRVCKCETIQKELGIEKQQVLEELKELKTLYEDICDRIENKYQEVICQFEYEKNLVLYVKERKLHDEIETEDWFYFYELLMDRRIIEKLLERKKKEHGSSVSSKEPISFSSFHFNEEANFLSCLNYYLKVNNYRNVRHNWLGMSANPFDEYTAHDWHTNINEKKKSSSVMGIEIEEEKKENQTSTERKVFSPLYYNLYIQEHDKWISGKDNSGDLLQVETIDFIWNKVVREGGKTRLFDLITANSIAMMERKPKKKSKETEEDLENTVKDFTIFDNQIKEIESVDYFEIDQIVCISQLVCALGMLQVGGMLIIKVRISFDNMLLSVFSILSICFSSLEVFRPSCCYSQNIVFLIGVSFKGITSIFLSSLNQWVSKVQAEMKLLHKEKQAKRKRKREANENYINGTNESTTLLQSLHYLKTSVIPKKWIRKSFFQEYMQCINYFVDFLIRNLKNCMHVSNMSLNKSKKESSKIYFLSEFFKNHRIVDMDRKDKLVRNTEKVYRDKETVREKVKESYEKKPIGMKHQDEVFSRNSSGSNSSYEFCSYNPKRIKPWGTNSWFTEEEDTEIFFPSWHLRKGDKDESQFKSKYDSTDKKNLLENPNIISSTKKMIHRYDKQIIELLKHIAYKRRIMGSQKKDFFELDKDIIQKREFILKYKNHLNQKQEFEPLLAKQTYFYCKNWFKTGIFKNTSYFEKSFFLKSSILKDLLACRYYIYKNKYDQYVNSVKQLLVHSEPILCSGHLDMELTADIMSCLFVLRNCGQVNILSNSHSLQNFIVMSNELSVFSFFSKIEKSGVYIKFVDHEGELLNHCKVDNTQDRNLGESPLIVNVNQMYEEEKSYKYFSELLVNTLQSKNTSSLIYIDLNSLFPNFVHVIQKEVKMKKHLVASLIIAFNYLKNQGHLIIRLSSILTFFTAGLLYILHGNFDQVRLFHPPSCDDLHLECYIFCESFRGNYVYRHYIQFLWDFIIGNKNTQDKVKLSKENNNNKEGNKKVVLPFDVYHSVPIYFIMNKYFVAFLKKHNSFYFKNHITVCLRYSKPPYFTHHSNKVLKYLLSHFFVAYVIPEGSVRKVQKSLILCSDFSDEEEDIDEEEEDEDEDEEDEEEENQLNDTSEEVENNFSVNPGMEEWFDIVKNETKQKENPQNDTDSSDSNYSIFHEFENALSEISVSESAWDSS